MAYVLILILFLFPILLWAADKAKRDMREQEQSQTIVVSGESGAGKTETAKLIVQFLSAASVQARSIEQNILDSKSVLQAFGNAKTERNNNSSRVGKFIEVLIVREQCFWFSLACTKRSIACSFQMLLSRCNTLFFYWLLYLTQMQMHYDLHGVLIGGRTSHFLLEKSRVCTQSPGERNYHVFYMLCAGAPQQIKNTLHLGEPNEYRVCDKCWYCLRKNSFLDSKNTLRFCAYTVSGWVYAVFRKTKVQWKNIGDMEITGT